MVGLGVQVFVAAAIASASAAGARVPSCPSAQATPPVTTLLERLEATQEGSSSIGTLTMQMTTPHWSRTLKLKVWAKGRDLALVRVLEGGPRELGMMTLKRDKQLWNYLPQAGHTMKLPSGMLGDSWMGSDFTNDDLVRGNSLTHDYDATLSPTTDAEASSRWLLLLTPKATAAVVWGKVELVLDRATCVPVVERFYDEEGALVRTMTFADVRAIGWRAFPMRVAVKPASGERETLITYSEMAFDVTIPDDTFSLHRLQQGK